MKTYSELKSEMDCLEAQMEEAKKRERAEALKKIKQLCKDSVSLLGCCRAFWRKVAIDLQKPKAFIG